MENIHLEHIYHSLITDYPSWSISLERVRTWVYDLLVLEGLGYNDMDRKIVRIAVKNGIGYLPPFTIRIIHDIKTDILGEDCSCQTKCDCMKWKLSGDKVAYEKSGNVIKPRLIKDGILYADVYMIRMNCEGEMIIPHRFVNAIKAYIVYKVISIEFMMQNVNINTLRVAEEEKNNELSKARGLAILDETVEDLSNVSTQLGLQRIFFNPSFL